MSPRYLKAYTAVEIILGITCFLIFMVIVMVKYALYEIPDLIRGWLK